MSMAMMGLADTIAAACTTHSPTPPTPNTTTDCPINQELHDISVQAAKACGGGILATDVFETDQGYSINEVNYTMEFRNSIDVTGVNIPGKIVDFVLEVGRK